MTEAMSDIEKLGQEIERLHSENSYQRATIDEYRDEIARLRTQLAKSESLCKLRGKRLVELQTLPAAEEVQDALDGLMDSTFHPDTCEISHPPEAAPLCQPLCNCGIVERKDKLDSLINRLAASGARLKAQLAEKRKDEVTVTAVLTGECYQRAIKRLEDQLAAAVDENVDTLTKWAKALDRAEAAEAHINQLEAPIRCESIVRRTRTEWQNARRDFKDE